MARRKFRSAPFSAGVRRVKALRAAQGKAAAGFRGGLAFAILDGVGPWSPESGRSTPIRIAPPWAPGGEALIARKASNKAATTRLLRMSVTFLLGCRPARVVDAAAQLPAAGTAGHPFPRARPGVAHRIVGADCTTPGFGPHGCEHRNWPGYFASSAYKQRLAFRRPGAGSERSSETGSPDCRIVS